MADSVTLVRRKIADSSLAFQNETLNAIVTLAAIEVTRPFITKHLRLLVLTRWTHSMEREASM